MQLKFFWNFFIRVQVFEGTESLYSSYQAKMCEYQKIIVWVFHFFTLSPKSAISAHFSTKFLFNYLRNLRNCSSLCTYVHIPTSKATRVLSSTMNIQLFLYEPKSTVNLQLKFDSRRR